MHLLTGPLLEVPLFSKWSKISLDSRIGLRILYWPKFCVSTCHSAPPVFPKAPLFLYLLSYIWLPGILWCENRILIVSCCLWDRAASWIRANFGVQSIKCQILKTACLRSLCTDEKVIWGPGIGKGNKESSWCLLPLPNYSLYTDGKLIFLTSLLKNLFLNLKPFASCTVRSECSLLEKFPSCNQFKKIKALPLLGHWRWSCVSSFKRLIVFLMQSCW